MTVRVVVKGENGYRLVFRKGLVWLLRPNGSPAHVSSWRPCCPAHVSMAAGTLGAIAVADWAERGAA